MVEETRKIRTIKPPHEIFDRLCIAARLVNITMGLECLIIDLSEGTMVECPPDHLSGCFCKRISSITGEEVNIDHLFQRCEQAAGKSSHLIYTCPFNLTNIIIPVIENRHLLAALQVGPILTTEADELLQKHALPRANMNAENLNQLRTYLQNLPHGNIDYIIALAEMITILAIERPLNVEISEFKVQEIKQAKGTNACSAVIDTALEFISNNFTDDTISLNTVAENVYVHPSHLSRVFSQQMNCRFRSYINMLRISLAKELLAETNMSIGEICREVGFSDQSYFDKVFKQHQEITPSQYRKQLKRESEKILVQPYSR